MERVDNDISERISRCDALGYPLISCGECTEKDAHCRSNRAQTDDHPQLDDARGTQNRCAWSIKSARCMHSATKWVQSSF